MFGEVKGHFLFQTIYFLCAGDVLHMCSGRAHGLTYQVLGQWGNFWRVTGHFLFSGETR